MLHIKDVIVKKISKWKDDIEPVVICRVSEEIVKEKSTNQVEVLFYKNKSLYIKCPNSVVANELYLIQDEIKNKVNKFFKKKILKKIIFKTI